MQEQEQDRGSKTLDLMSRESTNGRIAYLLLTQFEILEIPISFVFCSSHDYNRMLKGELVEMVEMVKMVEVFRVSLLLLASVA